MGRTHRDHRQGTGARPVVDPTVALPRGTAGRGAVARRPAARRPAARATAARATAARPTASRPAAARATAVARGTALGLCARSALLGVAAGSRASLALAGPTLHDPRRGGLARTAARLGVLAELVGDKQPSAPSRITPPGPQSRAVSAALGGAALARQRGRAIWLPAATAAVFSLGGTIGGAAWRAWAARAGHRDLPAALAEDAVALTLATVATRTRG